MKGKSLSANYIFNFLKTLCGILFPVITFTYSARILGVDGVGQVQFSRTMITYFSMIAMLGMNNYGVREAARVRDHPDQLSQFAQEALAINALTTAAAYVLFFLSLYIIPKFHDYRFLLLIASGEILLQSMGLEWLYQALEEYRYIALRSLAFQILALGCLFLFVRDRDDIAAYMIISIAATSGSYILNFIHAKKYIRFRRYPEYHFRRHFKPLLVLFAMAVSIELYNVLDTTMLGFIHGDAAVGRYTAAIKINRVMVRLLTSLSAVMFPRISYYIGRNETEKTRRLIYRSYNYVFLLSVPCCVGLYCLSTEVILMLCGAEFLAASFTMRIMIPIMFVIPFSATTNQQTLVPMGEEWRILIATCVGAVTNIICNALLIPRFAEDGAAVGTLVAETAVAIVSFYNGGKFYLMKPAFAYLWQYVLAASPIPLIVWAVRHCLSGYFFICAAAIPVSGVIYGAILILLRNPYGMDIPRKLSRRMGKRVRR